MSAFNQSRSRVIQIIFLAVFFIIVAQLINLQIFSPKLKLAAENNAIFRKVVYPDRGIIFDRKRKALLENTITYDLVVTPSETKGTDTLALCELLNIDTAEYRKRIREIIFKNTAVRPSVFEPLLTQELYARLYENMYKFPGFILNERKARSYPFNVGASLLGYIAEVDTGFLRRHKEEGYEQGDYTGMTGLERSYEKVLMGQRGIQRLIKDNRGRIQGTYESGVYDTAAVAGKNLFTSIDVELQQLGEKLMQNKVGSIVAIDPKTGGILCMISAPTYNPNYLTGNERSKHIRELSIDPRLPFNNRGLGTYYSPGSTFKTVVGMVGLSEGVISDHEFISCSGAFYGCGTGKPKCLDKGVFDFRSAIAHSDNTYFATVYKRILDQSRYGGADSALRVFNRYAYEFGLGHKLGVDLPTEKRGIIPVSEHYQKIFGRKWYSCNVISNAIGQGEVNTTLVQLANVMALIANKGWFYTPHVVDSIDGGDEYELLKPYHERHMVDLVSQETFEKVHDGMQAVMEEGTAAASKIPGIVVCGKTGTVENYFHGVKQKDHSFFGAFAPRDNPKIAIAVMCENAGFGAATAAPIASLMIEKYLRDSIAGKERQDLEEEMSRKNLIPALMREAMNRMDSLKQVREKQKEQMLQEKLNKESGEESEMEVPVEQENKTPEESKNKKQAPVKARITAAAILNEEEQRIKKAITRI